MFTCTTITEIVSKGHSSNLQSQVDDVIAFWADNNKIVFSTDKCKELRISFSNLNSQGAPGYDNVTIHSRSVSVVSEHKILGLIVRQDLKWNSHEST